ncbi:MAG: TIGR02281 family clan AA aspartic protease [Pseudomonadota bacterium]
MLGRFALFAFGVIGFAVMVVPRQGAEEAQQPPTKDAVSNQADASWYEGDHSLSRRGDGHFYALANVNGASVSMLVDTGASVVALTGADAQAAGLLWNESDIQPVARGASGTVYGVPTRLREVRVGSMTQTNVAAVIVPNGLDVSLLGQSYLGRLGTVEISGDTMELSAY